MEKSYTSTTTIKLQGQLMDLSTPRVMGILNITPDSFYDGGSYPEADALRRTVMTMLNDGVDILDVGAYSSRPGAIDISVEEEMSRLTWALDIIREMKVQVAVSVDTFRSEIAAFVLEHYQVAIINDISGGDLDANMYDVVARYGAAYMMMHMRGTPQTMIQLSNYDHLMAEMLRDFSSKINKLKAKGVHDIIVDPGFGFAKDLDQNYQLLAQLHLMNALQVPLLVGVSRKSMIYKLLDTTPQASLNGTTALHMLALSQGATILRVHDVNEAKECITIFSKMKSFL